LGVDTGSDFGADVGSNGCDTRDGPEGIKEVGTGCISLVLLALPTDTFIFLPQALSGRRGERRPLYKNKKHNNTTR
jgi:hypothetical protein